MTNSQDFRVSSSLLHVHYQGLRVYGVINSKIIAKIGINKLKAKCTHTAQFNATKLPLSEKHHCFNALSEVFVTSSPFFDGLFPGERAVCRKYVV